MDNLKKIGESSPLIHNITNYVVMNSCANALLAIGASPIMSHSEQEVAQIASASQALVVNIGTLSNRWVDAMETAMMAAFKAGVPIVYDPVGAGATDYRNAVNNRLLNAVRPAIIKGNGSEIMALAAMGTRTKGVDSTVKSDTAIQAARKLSDALGSVVVISGEIDYVVYGDRVSENSHGTPLMTRVTGMGCMGSAICGAFAAVDRDAVKAALDAMTLMGLAGERALEVTNLPGSFAVAFIDSLYELSYK